MDVNTENKRLKKSVSALLARIEDNQRISSYFQDFEFELLQTNSIVELLELLLDRARSYFKLVDVGLILVDRHGSIADLIEKLSISHRRNRLQLRVKEDSILQLYAPKQMEVTLGEMDALSQARIFPNSSDVGSVALLPLVRKNTCIGSLHFASEDPKRFTADKASDFLSHLAHIAGFAIENCLAHEYLRLQSQTDRLTKVSNRIKFDESLARELATSDRTGSPLACLFIDIDHFKQVNDNHGHHVGDRALQVVAQVIDKQLRKTDLLARYGGEEFVVLLPRCELAVAEDIAERIRASIQDSAVELDEGALKLTASLGLSCWRPQEFAGENVQLIGERLLEMADEAMYQAKTAGRNCVKSVPFSLKGKTAVV